MSTSAEEPQCSGKVGRFQHCYFAGKVERDGKWYCRIHDPVAVEARRKKHYERRVAKWAAKGMARDRENRMRSSHGAAVELAQVVLGVATFPAWPSSSAIAPPDFEEWTKIVILARRFLELAGEEEKLR